MFFFFQAEDGIRDLTVTGVQTCALPICDSGLPGVQGRSPLRGDPHHLSGLSQGLPDPRRDPGDADQRGRGLVTGTVVAGGGTAPGAAVVGGPSAAPGPLPAAPPHPAGPPLLPPPLPSPPHPPRAVGGGHPILP